MSHGGLRSGAQFGPYLLVAELGRGAMGQVFRARDASGRELALKVLLRPESERQLQRFVREGQITATLNHPGILRVHDAGAVQGWPYLLYELIEGASLEELLRSSSQAQLLDHLVAVADAVGHAHANGVLHRDLKPSNVLIDRDGRAVVCDFGLAAGMGLERLTQSGAMVGTPSYMAPEQLAGKHELFGPPVDVWALGVLLYQILTGRLPFNGRTLLELARQVATARPRPPHADPGVSRPLGAVCLRALERDPGARYPDAAAFAAALRAARAEGGATADRPSWRRPVGLSALVLGGLGVAAWTILGADPAPSATPAAASTPAPADEPDPPVAAKDPAAPELLALERALDGVRPEQVADRLATLDVSTLRRSPGTVERVTPAYVRLGAELRARLTREGERPAPEAEVLPWVNALGDLAELCPDARPLPTTAETLDALVAWMLVTVDLDDMPIDVAEAAVRLGGSPPSRTAGARLFERGVRYRTDPAEASRTARFMVACTRMDMTLGFYRFPSADPAYLPQGQDPMSQALRLRLEVGLEDDAFLMERLRELMHAPPPGLELGPRVWAEWAALACRSLEREEAMALLEEALERDPESPLASFEYAARVARSRPLEEAAEASAAAAERYRRSGYDTSPTSASTYRLLLALDTRNQALLGKRAEARASFRALKPLILGDDEVQRLQREFPWLEEPEPR
ncbi:MAG: serine/threonine-protein kinase [Planctomycetota bacterium]